LLRKKRYAIFAGVLAVCGLTLALLAILPPQPMEPGVR